MKRKRSADSASESQLQEEITQTTLLRCSHHTCRNPMNYRALRRHMQNIHASDGKNFEYHRADDLKTTYLGTPTKAKKARTTSTTIDPQPVFPSHTESKSSIPSVMAKRTSLSSRINSTANTRSAHYLPLRIRTSPEFETTSRNVFLAFHKNESDVARSLNSHQFFSIFI